MLKWTGERFLPWLEYSAIAYEHLHRYAYASTFAKGKRVLDLASGEGYGSKMMAANASFVVGVDIDDKAVQHAKTKYGSSNLQFLTGSICSVPIAKDHSFDLIVCFEAIEHIEDHQKLLTEVKRLLQPGGIFIVSTPNKLIYHDEAKDDNPFHLKELYFEEFQQILARYFANIHFLGQRIHPGSTIWPIGSTGNNRFEEFVIERGDSEFRFITNDQRVPLYFIAIASDSDLPADLSSVLIDQSDALVIEAQKALAWREEKISSLEEGLEWKQKQLEEGARTVASLEQAVHWREQQAKQYEKDLGWAQSQMTDLRHTIASHEQALAWRAQQVEKLENDKAEEKATLTMLLQKAQRELESIYGSPGWKFVVRLRRIRNRLRSLFRV
jgi:O-antigen biosynthesis protein